MIFIKGAKLEFSALQYQILWDNRLFGLKSGYYKKAT